MKQKKFFVFLTCLALLFAVSQNTISAQAMGLPHDIYVYMQENGLSILNIDDIQRAELATGIYSSDGTPISDEYRKKLEATFGGGSSPPAPAASTPETGQTEKPASAVQKHEHTYTSEITKEPTCTEPGEETFTCDECAASYVDEVAPLDHEYVESVTKEASCTEEDEMSYACSRCDVTYDGSYPGGWT